jgi:hypothetical protein
MILTRSGARRDHGKTEIVNKEMKDLRFDSKTQTVRLEARNSRDPINHSTYDYRFSLSLDEIGAIVALLGEKTSKEDLGLLATALRSHTRSLLRLANISAGITVEAPSSAFVNPFEKKLQLRDVSQK